MGLYDLPAIISYVSNLKKRKVLLVTHSMGGTSSYVMATRRPAIASMLYGMVQMAPAAYLTHITGPFKYVATFVKELEVTTILY